MLTGDDWLSVTSPDERRFYEIEARENSWGARELERQIASSLYERLSLSRDKDGIKALAQTGLVIEQASDVVKNPYVLEFLGMEEKSAYSEHELESAIIDHLEHFLLELGKGFLFEARQKRFTFDNDHFYVDLVFYNRLLRCYVLIDLKRDKLTHQDLGQMQMYVNYFDRHVKTEDELPTIRAAAHHSIGKGVGYWEGLCRKGGEIIDIRSEILPFLNDPDGFCARQDKIVIKTFFEKINIWLGRNPIEQPPMTLAKEVAERILKEMLASEPEDKFLDVYKKWMDSKTYEESLKFYCDKVQVQYQVQEPWGVHPLHPFTFVDQLWLKDLAKHLSDTETIHRSQIAPSACPFQNS